MRKIISIMLTLGLILGLVVVATPASAHFVCAEGVEAGVVVTDPCACDEAVYNITVNFTASLTEGLNHVCVEFPEGTTVPEEFADGDITIGPKGGPYDDVFGDEVTVDGLTVCFLVPEHIASGSEVVVTFLEGIENPCEPGKYTLYIWSDRAADSDPVPGKYTIIPEFSSYVFNFDFSPTYPGVAYGFVPPFRACGQNDTNKDYDTTYVDMFEGFVTNFTLVFEPDPEGCQAPCDEVDLFLEVINIPDQEIMHLVLNSTVYNLTICNITKTVGKFDSSTDIKILDDFALAANTTISWNCSLHFSSPSKEYEISLCYDCPKTTCAPGGVTCTNQVFKVYQDKEAYKLQLWEKWNLVSLPLVPLVDPPTVEEYLASVSLCHPVTGSNLGADGAALGQAVIGAMHYFDAFDAADPWKRWVPGDPANDLTELEDGKAYWLYVAYPLDEVLKELSKGAISSWTCDHICWWIWGTEKPVPPAAPSQYAVNTGWNMVGFTSTNLTMNPDDYLWNWGAAPDPDPVVYGYSDNCWNLQTWQLINFSTGLLVPGEGYFIAFPHAGSIFVP